MGLITFFWFGSNHLGAVIGAAMIINLLAAAIAGIFIPLHPAALGLRPGRRLLHRVRDDGLPTWWASSPSWGLALALGLI